MRKIVGLLLILIVMIVFSSVGLAQTNTVNQRARVTVPARVVGTAAILPTNGDCRLCRTDQIRRARTTTANQWWRINGTTLRGVAPATQPRRVSR
jgi:hypothetical protein